MDPENVLRNNTVSSENISILVESERASTENRSTIQLCPALLLASQKAIPNAVKHIYSRLAAYSTQIDEGIPDVIISLVATGNAFDLQCRQQVQKALCSMVANCNSWLLTSGEADDPLAKVASNVFRSLLPTRESNVETLMLAINSADVIANDAGTCTRMTDATYNTLCVLWMKKMPQPEELALFRTLTAVRLATPPPALLIGVPNGGGGAGTPSQTVLLPPSNTDHRPIHAALFCGADLLSLFELRTYLQCGVPVLVMQDSSELCAILNSSWLLYRSSAFDYDKWMEWLDAELRSVAQIAAFTVDEAIAKAKENIVSSFAAATGDATLLAFISLDQMDSFNERLLHLCMQSALDAADVRRLLHVSCKLAVSSVISSIELASLFNKQDASALYEEAFLNDSRLPALSALLEQGLPVIVTFELLTKMLQTASDQYFFNNVIVGQCLGRSYATYEVDLQLITDINKLLKWLSGGVRNLLPVEYFELPDPDESRSIQILAIWALLLNRTELTKCLCSYSAEPIPLSLALARISRSLAYEARDWFFYENNLISLSRWLSDHCIAVLERSHSESPRKTYRSLCIPLESFNGLTLTEFALQTNNKQFVAHRCCQRWVHRLLYANLQMTSSKGFLCIPKWMKIIISALFMLPIRWWTRIRVPEHCGRDIVRCTPSPTVAFLQNGRLQNRRRPYSSYSMISARSSQRDDSLLVIRDGRTTAESSETPQSEVIQLATGAMQPETITLEDIDAGVRTPASKRKRKSCRQPHLPIAVFYSTPIVKFWLSLIFRLAHLLLLAYTITLPGCGSLTLDALVWVWTFTTLLESIWVFSNRLGQTTLRQLRWQLFDICAISVQLSIILVLKFFVQYAPIMSTPVRSAYAARIFCAFFLLYLSYSTLFHYIPLSETFGPLMVRVKLMVMRDFVNFLILVVLVMGSSGIAVHVILYPDHSSDFGMVSKALSWAWLSLFTTDLSGLHESDSCKKSYIGEPKEQCVAIGGYGNYQCPSQSWAGYFAVVEYLIVLKLISWPILFALFAKTAKEVDEEADRIWKYQLYSLVENFRLRPVFPPPFTPIFFLGVSCCRATGCFSNFFHSAHRAGADHPDVISNPNPSMRSLLNARFGLVFRNPSVPTQSKDTHFKFESTQIWSGSKSTTGEHKQCTEAIKQLKEQLKVLIASTNFSAATMKDRLHSWYGSTTGIPYEADGRVRRLCILERFTPWNVLITDYCPPFYCKPSEEFPQDLQKYVDPFSCESLDEVRRQWRQKQQSELYRAFKMVPVSVTPSGLPLNPSGRKGIAGRGSHLKFGQNIFGVYVILHGENSKDLQVLLNDGALPSGWRFETGRLDSFLESILKDLQLPEYDISVLSNLSQLQVGETDSYVAHVERRLRPDPRDTDNAWAETDVWSIYLGSRVLDLTRSAPYRWHSVRSCPLTGAENEFLAASIKLFSLS